MLESEIFKAFFTLLRLGLWGNAERLELFPLSEKNWYTIYKIAEQHTVEGIIFEGIQLLPNEYFPPSPLLMKWVVKIEFIERRNLHMQQVTEQLFTLFNKHNLYPTLLKGQTLAGCYLNPLRRISGDIDVYFKDINSYKKANSLLASTNIKITETAGFSNHYRFKNIDVEHHRRMFDIHNPFCHQLLKNLEAQGCDQAIYKHVPTCFALPEPLVMQVQVNAHILKHLLSFGIGLRQICDTARFAFTYQQYIDGDELREVYRKLGILKWIELLHTILTQYIGLPQESLPFSSNSNIDARWMMEDIIVAGNFGFHNLNYEMNHSINEPSRKQAKKQLWNNAKRYFSYAPLEVMSFPIVQAYSKLLVK